MWIDIYKLSIRTEDAPFYWLPRAEFRIWRDQYCRDYYNYHWAWSFYWLGGCVDFVWDNEYAPPFFSIER